MRACARIFACASVSDRERRIPAQCVKKAESASAAAAAPVRDMRAPAHRLATGYAADGRRAADCKCGLPAVRRSRAACNMSKTSPSSSSLSAAAAAAKVVVHIIIIIIATCFSEEATHGGALCGGLRGHAHFSLINAPMRPVQFMIVGRPQSAECPGTLHFLHVRASACVRVYACQLLRRKYVRPLCI